MSLQELENEYERLRAIEQAACDLRKAMEDQALTVLAATAEYIEVQAREKEFDNRAREAYKKYSEARRIEDQKEAEAKQATREVAKEKAKETIKTATDTDKILKAVECLEGVQSEGRLHTAVDGRFLLHRFLRVHRFTRNSRYVLLFDMETRNYQMVRATKYARFMFCNDQEERNWVEFQPFSELVADIERSVRNGFTHIRNPNFS